MASRSITDMKEMIEEELDGSGLDFYFERGGKHPCVVIQCGGKEHRYYFAGTTGSSSNRAKANTRCGVRRLLRRLKASVS